MAVSGSRQAFNIVSVPTLDVSRITVFLKSISRPSPSSSAVPFVKHLKEKLEDIGMGLFDLVQENDAVRTAADGLGQHAPLAVAVDVAGRRASLVRLETVCAS